MKKIAVLVLALMIAVIGSAQVSIVTGTGGTGISADNAANAIAPAYTALGAIQLQEGTSADIATTVTQLVLNAPAGWEFNTLRVIVK